MGHFSTRAMVLLSIVEEATQWEGDERPGQKLTRYYYPRDDRIGVWLSRWNRFECQVGGSGDSRIFDSLERKGLIRRMKPEVTTGSDRYCYVITEDGIKAVADDKALELTS